MINYSRLEELVDEKCISAIKRVNAIRDRRQKGLPIESQEDVDLLLGCIYSNANALDSTAEEIERGMNLSLSEMREAAIAFAEASKLRPSETEVAA